eukprot:scaffold10818_cov133-Isochrysis_galbana.AAC.2
MLYDGRLRGRGSGARVNGRMRSFVRSFSPFPNPGGCGWVDREHSSLGVCKDHCAGRKGLGRPGLASMRMLAPCASS